MYLINPQLSGPVAQSLMSGIQLNYRQYDPYINYLYNMSLTGASDGDLYNIGIIMGCPWPYIANPDTQFSNSFTFSDAALYPEIGTDGFSDDAGTFGGLLIGSGSGYASLIPRNYYQAILTQFASIKASGFSLVGLDNFCASITSGYTISWTTPDIYVTFQSFTDTYTIQIAQYVMNLLTQHPAVFFAYSGVSNNLLFFDTATYPTIDNLQGLADDASTLGGFMG